MLISTGRTAESRPTRARGLKLALQRVQLQLLGVASHAGAWIETGLTITGVGYPASRPTRARGLKLCFYGRIIKINRSRPTRARGLKHTAPENLCFLGRSRPTRARGLKRRIGWQKPNTGESRPTRARGLKQVGRRSVLSYR